MKKLTFLLLLIGALNFANTNSKEDRKLYNSYVYAQWNRTKSNILTYNEWLSYSEEDKVNLFLGNKFVTTTGGGSHDGTNEANAWTIQEAFANASPGDHIYLKAGNYGALSNLTFNTNGTASNRITFEGYKTTIGDITASGATTLYTGGQPNTSESPCFIGTTSSNRPNQNRGLIFQGDYLTIKNIGTYSYNIPFQSTGDNCIIDNVYSYKSGNHNAGSEMAGFLGTFPTGAYTGYGMIVKGDNNTVTNCYILDAGAEGFRFDNGDNFFAQNITVRSVLGVGSYNNPASGNGNGTDYHFIIGANASNVVGNNINVYQPIGAVNGGHGIVVKGLDGQPITNVEIDGFYVENTKIETQFPNTTNVTFINGQVHNSHPLEDARIIEVEANITNGSRYTTVENVRFTNGAHIAFRGWDEYVWNGAKYDGARDALIKNCSFEGSGQSFAIYISYGPGNKDGWKNFRMTFDHVTINNYDYLFAIDADNEDVDFHNTIINDIPYYSHIRYMDGSGALFGTGGPYNIDDSYSSANFYDGFNARSGTSVTTLNPSLVDSKTTNGTLLTAGVATANYASGLPLGYLGATSAPTDTTPPGVLTVNTSEITDTSFKVLWTLNEDGTRYIEWGETTSYGNLTSESIGYYSSHFQTITGLQPNTTYHFRVRGEDEAGNEYNIGDFTETTLSTNPTPEIDKSIGEKGKYLKTIKM